MRPRKATSQNRGAESSELARCIPPLSAVHFAKSGNDQPKPEQVIKVDWASSDSGRCIVHRVRSHLVAAALATAERFDSLARGFAFSLASSNGVTDHHLVGDEGGQVQNPPSKLRRSQFAGAGRWRRPSFHRHEYVGRARRTATADLERWDALVVAAGRPRAGRARPRPGACAPAQDEANRSHYTARSLKLPYLSSNALPFRCPSQGPR